MVSDSTIKLAISTLGILIIDVTMSQFHDININLVEIIHDQINLSSF